MFRSSAAYSVQQLQDGLSRPNDTKECDLEHKIQLLDIIRNGLNGARYYLTNKRSNMCLNYCNGLRL